MVLENHGGGFGRPLRLSDSLEMGASERDRGWYVVERPLRPDAHVVQRRGNGDLVFRVRVVRSKRDTQVRDPVGVIPVRDSVTAHGRGVLRQQLVELRNLVEQLYGARNRGWHGRRGAG